MRGENGGVLSPIRVRRPPRFIATLLAHAAATRGQTLSDVAQAIGIDETTLMHLRSGRRRLSMDSFAKILVAYGDDRAICNAAIMYARFEYRDPGPDSLVAAVGALPSVVVEHLRAFVARLPDEAVTSGRGLFLTSGDARMLSLAVQYLARAFEHARVRVCHLRADRPVSAADRRNALAAPVLLVERVDFMCEPLPELLMQRANLIRPIIATSMAVPEVLADAHLRRVFASMTQLVEIGPSTLHPSHEPRAVESRK